MVNDKNKFIFIHIPKCGGSSMTQLLKNDSYIISGWDPKKKLFRQHCTLLQLKKIYNIAIEEYFSFTFTRNPWDRVVSDHFTWQEKSNFYKKILNNTTIKDYLLCRNGYEKINHLDTPLGRGDHFRPQYEYIINENNQPMIDYIGKIENYQQDFDIACKKIGISKLKLPHLNRRLLRGGSKHQHYTEYYDQETIQLVAQKYAKDIEYFGYQFGE